MSDQKPLRNPKDYINVTVLRANHECIKKYLEEQGEGKDIGKFYDLAAMEKMKKEKSNNNG